jgi:hypothetical protein
MIPGAINTLIFAKPLLKTPAIMKNMTIMIVTSINAEPRSIERVLNIFAYHFF